MHAAAHQRLPSQVYSSAQRRYVRKQEFFSNLRLKIVDVVQSAAMSAIVTALRKGVFIEDLRAMMEAAAAALEAAAEQEAAKPSGKATPAARRRATPAADDQEAAPVAIEVAQEVCILP